MDDHKPWWADDPELAAIRLGVEEELERARREPIEPEKTDPVLADLWSGASLRELAAARDDLACANARYTDAVRGARAAGLAWGEIARVLGVPKQPAAPPLQPTRADSSSLSCLALRMAWPPRSLLK